MTNPVQIQTLLQDNVKHITQGIHYILLLL